MTEQEMIDEMVKLQRAYDAAVYKEFNCEFDDEKCRLAMIDEIGEFNHEMKANWCWWKKTQKPVDREKALEELVDIWHFALSLSNHLTDLLDFDDLYYDFVPETYSVKNKTVSELYEKIMIEGSYRLEYLYELGKKADFTLEDVFEAYKKKNKVNWERLANGY